ncbi:MAG: hypothetical protein ACI3ZQ_06445, partial [Candidatus Cryptobacteroides sp.]
MKLSSKIALHLLCAMSVICICACSGNNEIRETLQSVESFIEEKPDSALAVLQNIDGKTLHKNADRAKYALLLSMALDKNYIDVTNDSIIAPAVQYYAHHGSADEKLKTNYYLGRIYGNAGDSDNEMKYYVSAERYVHKSSDYNSIGRLYTSKALVYSGIYDFNDAIENQSISADYFLKAKNIPKYISAQLKLCNFYINVGEKSFAKNKLNVVKGYWRDMSDWQRSDYFSRYLVLAAADEKDSLISVYNKELKDSSLVNWLAVANSYYQAGCMNKSINALIQYKKYNKDFSSAAGYMALCSKIMYESGNFKAAYDALERYVNLSDKKDMTIFKGNTKSIENFEIAQYKNTIQKLWLCVLILGITLLALVLTIAVCMLRRDLAKRKIEKDRLEHEKMEIEKERLRYEQLYTQAKVEAENLQTLVDSTKLDDNVRLAVTERLNVLNKFISENISYGASKSISQELERLIADREGFIESTKMSFILAHPNFMKYLKDAGLTDKEIGF